MSQVMITQQLEVDDSLYGSNQSGIKRESRGQRDSRISQLIKSLMIYPE